MRSPRCMSIVAAHVGDILELGVLSARVALFRPIRR